ncbi:MAG: glycerol-3-phosphate acyltransferase [Bacteroidia bacterium]|nr:glycerol-3-phosphate acyltransferase [Bacteroidia bacterium]
MHYFEVFLLTFITYILGAVSVSFWMAKLFYGIDIREHGEGVATWRNITAVIGKKEGWFAAFAEICKYLLVPGFAIFGKMMWGWFESVEYPLLMLFLGVAAISGALFPMFITVKNKRRVHYSLTGRHVLNFGALLLCALLGWDLYYIFRHQDTFYTLIDAGLTLEDAALGIYFSLFITLVWMYFMFQHSLEAQHKIQNLQLSYRKNLKRIPARRRKRNH